MGVSQFKQPVPPIHRPQPPQPPQQPPQAQAPRWEIGIDRNKVAAFIGGALIAGFGFGYLAARYLAYSRDKTEKARVAAKAPAVDPADADDNKAANAGLPDFHKVTKIIRADMIEAEGVGGIRMIGVNPAAAADQNSSLAQSAMKFTSQSLLGKDVRIELEPLMPAGSAKDDAGNTLAYVYTRDGALFNEELIKQGDAFAKVDQPSKFLDKFRAAEREAMENTRGIWAPSDKSGKGALAGLASDKTGRRSPLTRLPDPMTPSIPANGLDARMPASGVSDPMVFVSSSDRMYHKEGCAYLGKKGRPMLLSEAKAAGYVACGRCFASTVLKAP